MASNFSLINVCPSPPTSDQLSDNQNLVSARLTNQEHNDSINLNEDEDEIENVNSQESSNSPKVRINRSPVWDYGSKIVEKGKVFMICKQPLCTYKIKYNSSTIPLKNHLISDHNIKLNSLDQNTTDENDLKLSSKKKNSINLAIVKFVIGNFLPFCIVENRYFIELLQHLNSHYKIISRSYLSNTLLQHAYESTIKKITAYINDAEYITLTTDIWTSIQRLSYISITAHFFDKGYNYRDVTLGVQNIVGSHSGETISESILNFLDEWNIRSKVCFIVTDNAANMAKAVEILNTQKLPGVKHMRCMGEFLLN